MVSDTFQLSQAHEAHERAVSWETSPRAWLSNVRAIEICNGLIPVPDFSGVPIHGLTEDEMSELLALRKEKKLRLSSVPSTNIIVCSHWSLSDLILSHSDSAFSKSNHLCHFKKTTATRSGCGGGTR